MIASSRRAVPRRMFLAVLLGVLLTGGVLPAGAGEAPPSAVPAPVAAPEPGGPCVPLGDVNRCPGWVQRTTNERGNTEACEGRDLAAAQVVTAAAVLVTGGTCNPVTGGDVQTAAYDLATGEELWVRQYDGPRSRADGAVDIAASPDGTRVYVAGTQDYRITEQGPVADFVTIAYDAAVGEERWVATYDGPAGRDEAVKIAVSPDGERVYVAGSSVNASSAPSLDFVAISYDASTGAEDWVFRYDNPDSTYDEAEAMGVRGRTVYVGGYRISDQWEAQVVAIEDDRDNRAGNLLWASTYGELGSLQAGMAVTPSAVILSGRTQGVTSPPQPCPVFGGNLRYTTLAVDPETGSPTWVKHYSGRTGFNVARSLVASPDGSTVYVSGWFSALASCGVSDHSRATVAYNVTDGSEKWVSHQIVSTVLPFLHAPEALAVSPDGAKVFIAYSMDFASGPGGAAGYGRVDYRTLALAASSGAQVWEARYNDSERAGVPDTDFAYLVGVSPDGTRVIVSGTFIRGESENSDFYDFGTVAYEAG